MKVQNHYEIQELKKKSQTKSKKTSKEVNFFNATQGLRFFSHRQKKKHFNGVIHICLKGVSDYAMLDFVSEMFQNYSVSIFAINKNIGINDMSVKSCNSGMSNGKNYKIMVSINNLPTKESTQEALDYCVLLNTWLGYYFKQKNQVTDYNIVFSMYHDEFEEENFWRQYAQCTQFSRRNLIINDLVRINTGAENEDLTVAYNTVSDKYYVYNYVYTDLENELLMKS